jgi:nucleotide-binding universal stress UspA family protein
LEHLVWVCAIGLSDDSERVLGLANLNAATVGARLLIVHATEERSQDEARRRLEHLLQAVDCEAEIQIATGRVKDAILEAASRSAADILIVGRQPAEGTSGRLRDLTYTLVRDSPCPVLSV